MLKTKVFQCRDKLNLHTVIACVVAYTSSHVCSEKILSDKKFV